MFCVAFGLASASCIGGPISDYPDKHAGDEDDDGPPRSPPVHSGAPRADAGSAGGRADASVSVDAGSPAASDGADGGDAGDGSAPSDAASALPNAVDGGLAP